MESIVLKEKQKKRNTLDRFWNSVILIDMMKTALQQISEKQVGQHPQLQGLPCVANVSRSAKWFSYNKFDTNVEEGGGGRS